MPLASGTLATIAVALKRPVVVNRPWVMHLARVLSVAGHPALLMPLAVVAAARLRGADVTVVWGAAGAAVFAAVAVGIFSAVKVRRGGWQHVDASQPAERRELNRFLLPLLFGLSAVLALAGQPRSTVLGMALGGLLVFGAHLLRRQLKVSLHVAFAVFAALLLWPSHGGTVPLLVLAAGVAWSRLALGRHTPAEVVLGALAGAACGGLWVVLAG
jgi:membrane-associated phospholipid phosphatase